ncbi:MAG TPA: hypothetical protein VFV61_00890, partial [Pyrinomonadaceae bacterium]|nr:hypothetical protein [Pyrinomonadaceae bacterium]
MQTLRPTIILVLLLTVGTSVDALGKGVPQRAKLPEAKQKKRTVVRTRKQSHKPRPSVFESVSDEGDNVEGRQSWFMFQRLYPFRTLPTEARRRAWESRPLRAKSAPGVENATASVWSPIGPMPTRAYFPLFDNFGFNSGRINAIAVSPANAQLILVGASTGGIWRSIDGGATFTPVSDAQVDLAVGAIAFSPSNPNIVYAGMGDMHSCCEYLGSGVLKSTDSGATWVRINNGTLPQPASVGDLEVDPTNSNKIYLALYRSLDAANANSFPY